MTPQEWIEDNNKILSLINDAKFMLPIIQGTHNSQIERIFVKGIAGDGIKIGDYSTKIMLASKDQFVVKTAFKQSFLDPVTGDIVDSKMEDDVPYWLTFKNKKTGARNKKATAIMFLGDGYKEFKEIQGKESGFVNLRLSENFKIDYTNSLRLEGGRVVTSVNSAINVKKYEGAVKKYGKRTFELTKEEMEKLAEKFALAVTKNMRKN